MSNALLAELAAARRARQPAPAAAATAATATVPAPEFSLTVKMVDKSDPVTVSVSPASTVRDLISMLTAKGVRPKILAFAGKRLLPGDVDQRLQGAGVRKHGPVVVCVGSRVSSQASQDTASSGPAAAAPGRRLRDGAAVAAPPPAKRVKKDNGTSSGENTKKSRSEDHSTSSDANAVLSGLIDAAGLDPNMVELFLQRVRCNFLAQLNTPKSAPLLSTRR